MTATITNLKVQVQAKINAATGSTSLEDLLILRKAADGLDCDETNLDTLVTAKQTAMSGSTTLDDLLIANRAADLAPTSVSSTSVTTPIGGVIEMPVPTPPKFTTGGMTFLRAGYAETSDYSPDLASTVLDTCITYATQTLKATITASGHTIDTDGAGMWLVGLNLTGSGSVSNLLKSTDDGVTWTDVTAAFDASGTTFQATECIIKHISGTGASSIWIYQNTTRRTRRTTNGGTSWAYIATIAETSCTYPWIAAAGTTVCISGNNGSQHYKSTDSGATFAIANFPVSNGGTPVTVNAIGLPDGRIVIAGQLTISGYFRPVLWISDTSGSLAFTTEINLFSSLSAQKVAAGLPALAVAQYNFPAKYLAYSSKSGRLYVGMSDATANSTVVYPLSTFTAAGVATFAVVADNIGIATGLANLMNGSLKIDNDGHIYLHGSYTDYYKELEIIPNVLSSCVYPQEQLNFSSNTNLGFGLNKVTGTIVFPSSSSMWKGVRGAGLNFPYAVNSNSPRPSRNVNQYMRIK